ncbi:hypothetical protein [Azorhizobium doebereinerae]|uniref:hypothetical protein n=1 Tax=Azorhizobium doebereinerae TaxID=281091 RepID=UPI0003FF4E71|nr:hypothetical protein [Azorhizobium doebereinerae]
MTLRSLAEAEPIAELVAKVLYERQYGRVWEDATQWARRDSLSCARTVIDTLRNSDMIPLPELAQGRRNIVS